jgi:hypothetical protein
MRWKIVLEGTDEFGSAHRSELTIDKIWSVYQLAEIGFSVENCKTIMAQLRQVVVNQRCEAYVPFLYGLRQVPTDQGLRQAKDPDGVRLRRG